MGTGNMEFDNVQIDVTFSQASERDNITSNENIALSFGKLSTWFEALVPEGGSSGQILGWKSSGTAEWINSPVSIDEKVKVDKFVSTTQTDYLLTGAVASMATTAAHLVVDNADGVASARMRLQKGTTDTIGQSMIMLGNNIASGTSNNMQGMILMYSSSDKYGKIVSESLTDNRTWTLPDKSGTIAMTSDITPVNNGKLTIKGGTTSVAEFTANQSGNTDFSIVAGSNVTVTPDATNHKITIASSHPTYTRTDTTSTASPDHGETFTAIDSVTSTNGHVTAVNVKTVTLPAQYVHPGKTQTDTSSTASPAHGGTFTVVDSVTRDTSGHVSGINVKTVTLPSDQNTDTLMTQTNTTGSADYRVLLSGNANDTTETTTGRKSTNLRFNPSSGGLYSFGFLWTDITGQTLDINTLTLSDGTIHSRRFIQKTDGGADNITNIPVAGHPFLLEVDLIRWASTTDYITRQRFTNAANGTYSYVRYCTRGTWGNWTTRKYTDTNTKVTSAANHYTPATASGGDISESASGATAAWSIDVVKGVTLNTDGKGHVTGLSVTSGKIPGNPVPSNNVTGSGTSGYLTKWNGANTITNGPQLGSSTTTFLRNDGSWATPTNTTYTFATGDAVGQFKVTPSGESATNYNINGIAAGTASGTAKHLAYYDSATSITSSGNLMYSVENSTASTPRSRTILHIFNSNTVGNDAAALISGTKGVLSYGDGGPQINFSTGSTIGGGQDSAIIWTDNDSAAAGASWHFVSSQSDWNVISKRFHARTGISIGTNLPNTSYNLYVNGTSQFNGTVTVSTNTFGTQLIVERSGSSNYASLGFKNNLGMLGYIGANAADANLYHIYAGDTSKQYIILDTGNTSVTTSGSGNAITALSFSNGTFTATKGSTFSLSTHTHSQYYDSTTSRTANTVLAAPNGSNGGATFRKLVAADLPDSYLPLSGGTMTGTLTAKASQYADEYSGALNMNNSNIYGVNSIYTADVSSDAAEGIHFYRDSTHVDTLWMNEGSLLFVPNRELGTSTTAANSQKVARFTANPTTGQVVITDGTTGGIKSSGSTIVATPSGKVNSNWGTTSDRTTIVTKGWMSYWDGSYNGSASNLTYCNQGAFGTIVTKSTTDYSKVSFSRNLTSGTKVGTITIDGTATDLYCQTNTNTDTKVNVTLATTTKAYLLATSTTPTSSAQAVTSIADTGVYLGTEAGSLYATDYHTSGGARGYFLVDKASKSYGGVYDNGSNLWIGAVQSADYHHKGSTYISTGWDGTLPTTAGTFLTGNTTIIIGVPKYAVDSNGKGSWDYTGYAAIHAGNYTSYTVTKTGGGASGSWGISITGNAATATTATNANVTVTDVPSTSTTTSDSWYRSYGLLFAQNPNTTQANTLRKSHNLRFYHSPNGTADTVGVGELIVGNNTASGTAGNMQGRLILYSSSSSYISMVPTATSSSVTLTLPAVTGTVPSFTATPTSGQVVITDGTGGGVKSSGSTIVATPSGKVNSNWGTTSDRTTIVTKGWMSYWDGSYNGSASNLTYCNQGAFGTIITKNTGDYVPNHGDLRSTIGSDCPAADVKTFFMTSSVPTATSSIGYNTAGNEYTLIFGKGTNTAGYGAVLKFGYNSLYPLMLRVQNGTWKSTDWEKISAGYADRATYLDVVASNEIRLYNDNQFNRNNHFWIGYSWAQGSHYTPSGGTNTASTTAPNITKYVIGNCSGGGLAGIHAASLILGQGDAPTSSSATSTLKAAAGTTGTYLLPSIGNGTYTLSCGHEDLSAGSGSLTSANVLVPSYTKFIKIVFKSDSSNTLYSMVEIPYFGNGDYSALVQVGTYADGYQGSPRIVMKAIIINIANGSETGKKTFTITGSPTTKINGSNVSDVTRNISIYKIYASD